MEKEGGSLVDRPGSIAVGEMLSKGMRILMARSGDRFRRLRKAVHTHLQPKVAETYQDMQRENAMIFVWDMLNDPKNPQKHAQRSVITMTFCDPFIDMYLKVCSVSHSSGDLWEVCAHCQHRS